MEKKSLDELKDEQMGKFTLTRIIYEIKLKLTLFWYWLKQEEVRKKLKTLIIPAMLFLVLFQLAYSSGVFGCFSTVGEIHFKNGDIVKCRWVSNSRYYGYNKIVHYTKKFTLFSNVAHVSEIDSIHVIQCSCNGINTPKSDYKLTKSY